MPQQPETETELLPPADQTSIVERADVAPINLQRLFDSAIAQGKDGADALATLMDLKCKMDDRFAATAFAAAMVRFQAECPMIRKMTTATVVHRAGGQHSYNYAELPEILRTAGPHLHANGLSHSWRTEENQEGRLRCVCIIRHRDGHTVETPVPCPLGSDAKMSDAQKCGSALTYFRRQSLVLALGLTTCDPDDDGAGGTARFEPISEEQAQELHRFMLDVNTDFEAFFAYFSEGSDHKITAVSDLPASRFAEAMRMLETKRAKQ